MRYCRSDKIEPLWPSEKRIISKEEVNKCERCGSRRVFEF
jgi:DNA-directed RNA polymerase subunit RPC12/RpoP